MLTYDIETSQTAASVVEEITLDNITLVIIEVSAHVLNYDFVKRMSINSAPPVTITYQETPLTTASDWPIS